MPHRTSWVLLSIAALAAPPLAAQERVFPDWCHGARIADLVLSPDTPDRDLGEFVSDAREDGASVILVHFEEENFYGSLVDEGGWRRMLDRAGRLLESARRAGLRVAWYVNGLEVMTPGAARDRERPSLARSHPDWLQRRAGRGGPGTPIVFTGLEYGWIAPDMEDAWICPLSDYGELLRARLSELAGRGLDAVWIDACFLPGVQPGNEPIWGCGCERCRVRFARDTGLSPDFPLIFADPAFQAWLAWREQLVASYLAGLAEHAWSLGVVPFYESSTLDSPDATLLGNDATILSASPIGYAPEIDAPGEEESMARASPEEWTAYLSMLLFARDMAGEKPCWVLQYAGGPSDAERELGMTLAATGNYFPVLGDDDPEARKFSREAFRLVREVAPLVRASRPLAPVAVLYSSRARDLHDGARGGQYSTKGTRFFRSYRAAVGQLVQAHVPFRIVSVPAGPDLSGVRAVVVPDGLPGGDVPALPPGCERLDVGPEGIARIPVPELPFSVEAPPSMAVLVRRGEGGWLVSVHALAAAGPSTIRFSAPRRFRIRTLEGERSGEGKVVELAASRPFHFVEVFD
ncbi:MAG: hypothetical protein HY720_02155 [Planctomycetes bacterium]|nr:hypothetical protein [Planctomycetota bacterium]